MVRTMSWAKYVYTWKLILLGIKYILQYHVRRYILTSIKKKKKIYIEKLWKYYFRNSILATRILLWKYYGKSGNREKKYFVITWLRWPLQRLWWVVWDWRWWWVLRWLQYCGGGRRGRRGEKRERKKKIWKGRGGTRGWSLGGRKGGEEDFEEGAFLSFSHYKIFKCG